MAISPNDIRFFYSGGSSNQDPLASLGGIISKTQIINEAQENVFNNVTLIEADNGMIDYRCFYVKNIGQELWRDVVIWREEGTDSDHDAVFIGVGTSIIDGIEQEVPDRFTKPINVTFSGPAVAESALLLGNLAPGSHKSVWVQRVVDSGSRTFKNNTFKLRVEIGNPAGGGIGGGLPPVGGGGGGGGGGTIQCPTGQHAVNGVCIPDTVAPIIGGENILWQSTAWANGRDRTITTDQGADPDDPALTFGFGTSRSLQIQGATDPGFVLQSGTNSHVMVSRNSSIANHYNASLEIQKFFFNTSVTNLNLRLRSRAYEGGVTANRYAGYGVVISRSTSSISFIRYDHLLNASTNTFDFTIFAPSQINLSSTLQDGVEYGLRYSVRDVTGGVELKLEMKGGAFGNSYVTVGNVTDTVAPPDALNKTLYINNRSYFHISVVGSPASNVKYGFVVLRDLDKNVSTTCPQGYTLVDGVCRANTLTPPPSGGGGAVVEDYTMTTVGDTTCGSTAQTITSRMIARNPNIHLPLGDYTYTSSTTCWISMMAPLKPKILGIVIGNHDDAEDESNTLRARYLSEYGQSLPYHAFTFRNTFVLVLYTYSPFGFGTSSAQYQFARQQLEAARNNPAIDWIICAFHKPIYTAASNHSGYTAFRDIYHPLFDQFKVDVCLSGHVHNYQRTKPLKYTGTGTGNSIANNQTTNYIDLVNPIFLIVGSGGRQISSLGSQPSYNAFQRAGFGYNIFSWSNNGKRLTGRHYDQGDVLRDEWTMDKTSVSNPPTNPPTTPPPPTGGTGGQLDNLGIRWIMATGAQVVDGQSRNQSADKRWSTNHNNIADNGYECTAYFTFSGVTSSGHFAMKLWGPNHSGCTNSTRCFWYDIGIRHNGNVQLQYERPHPNNHNFSLSLNSTSGPKYMDNIGQSMNGNTIGLKWIIYPVVEGGTSDSSGGIRIKFFADTSGLSGGKPQNQWRRVVDFVDNGQVRPSNTTTHQEQDLEIRVSDTSSVTTYGGGKHVRRLTRADINRGEMTGGGTTTFCPAGQCKDQTTNQCRSIGTGEQVDPSTGMCVSATTPPPSGSPGNDDDAIKMIYPTKPDGDIFRDSTTFTNHNSRIGILNIFNIVNASGEPWKIVRNSSSSPAYIFLYTNENGPGTINNTQRAQSPPITTFNHNNLASPTLGYFYQVRDWKNIEFTIYFHAILGNNASDSKEMNMIVRSVNHALDFGGCGGSSYHADFNWSTGNVRFKKEQYHNSYVMETYNNTGIGNSFGKLIGLKFIVWNRSDGNVQLELWIDKDANNTWAKYIEKTDSHDWGTGAGQCAGTPPGKAITWGSPVTVLKWNSNDHITFNYISVREIHPPT